MSDRFQAFDEKERALLCVVLTTAAVYVTERSTTRNNTEAIKHDADTLADIAMLIGEINETMGGRPFDAELLAKLRAVADGI